MKQNHIILQLFGWGVAMFVSSVAATAQANIVPKAQIDEVEMMMGKQTTIHLELSQDKGVNVIRPKIAPRDTLTAGVEVLKVSESDTVDMGNNRIQVSRDILITSFDHNLYDIPPFKYVVGNDTVATESLALKVLEMPIDTTTLNDIKIKADQPAVIRIKDIKPIEQPEDVFWDKIPTWALWTAPFALLGVLLAALGYFLYRRYYKKNDRKRGKPEVVIPPYDRAIEELRRLKEANLWQQGQEKLYYTGLTDILREYIDGRFHINAMEMTTTQILNALRKNNETKAKIQSLREVLGMADFVKFAKMSPLPEENERAFTQVETFVNETKPVEQAPEEAKQTSERTIHETKGETPLKQN